MIKRILVALDPDEDTTKATDYAITLARKFDADVTGLALVDTEQIQAGVGGGGIGTIYYADQLTRHMTDTARREGRKLLTEFRKKVQHAGLNHAEHIEEGVPFERIVEDMKIHDLLIIGKDSHFFYNRPEKTTKTLDKVVKEGICPVMVVSKESPEPKADVKKVLLAYDGSGAVARTMQWFVQLQPFGNHITVDVIHVRDGESEKEKEESYLLLKLAGSFLNSHGFNDVNRESLEHGKPAKKILDYAEENGVDIIIAGAHSVSAIKRLTFGSTTDTLVKENTIPLFLSH